MPSPASKPPSGAASTRVTRTPSRRGTGPVAASATTAGAAGGPTTTTSSPPPSSNAHPLRYTHAAALIRGASSPARSRARRRLRRPVGSDHVDGSGWRWLTRDLGAQNDGRRTLFNPLGTGVRPPGHADRRLHRPSQPVHESPG